MLTSAKVVRRSPATWWETITIDKGGDNRLAPQIPVISEQGLVGKVDRVFNDLSTVLLLTDESCLISAKVDGTPEHGIISGQRGKYGEESLLRLKYLTNDISVPQGTKVYTSGKGGVFPDNILIGTIVSIETGALYAEALVKPSFNLDESEVVFAIVNDQ